MTPSIGESSLLTRVHTGFSVGGQAEPVELRLRRDRGHPDPHKDEEKPGGRVDQPAPASHAGQLVLSLTPLGHLLH